MLNGAGKLSTDRLLKDRVENGILKKLFS